MNNSRFLIEKSWKPETSGTVFSSAKRKELSTFILYLEKLAFRNEREIMTFSDGGKLKEFVGNQLTLKYQVKEVMQ